ncbi:MAG TPA: NrfD/PsrC family molybdoenzyme membrane anchor subunit [Candidatus Brocadiia bacterium]|nr:polysulfide reductase NrfD [Candidatus Brocadiales bacterium]
MVEIKEIYNVHHHLNLTVLIANYFYFTGLSAGSFILSTLAYGFGMLKYKPLGKVGVIMAVLLLGLAPLNLLVELEQTPRFYHLFMYLNLTSPITYGSFLLTTYPINCIIYGYFMFKGDMKKTKILGLIGIPLALSVHGYTGFILALGKARILWNTALMPTIFLVSAMVSGIALMILVVFVLGRFVSHDGKTPKELIYDLVNILVLTILFDLALVGCDILVLLTSHEDALMAAKMILIGSFAPVFVGGELIMGAIVPLVLFTLPFTKRNMYWIAVACLLVMLGIFCMRYTMVVGGQCLPQS